MKHFVFVFVAVLGFATPAFLQQTYSLWYDSFYDQGGNSLNDVVCSTGVHGLLTRGYKTFEDLPHYPFIGGAPQITSWDSPNCGTCWELTYTDSNDITGSLTFIAINTGVMGGFSISLAGMNRLTSGNAMILDGVFITVNQLPESDCIP